MSRTCVFFHAHPDDEALLTGGTMARLAAEGHRVVLVVATAGERGLSEHAADLGAVRTREALASARKLGCARVEFLGYADSGLDGAEGFARADGAEGFARADGAEGFARADGAEGFARADGAAEGFARADGAEGFARADGAEGFARADVAEAAGRLAEILHEERADLLTTYDPVGGYGHPDHVQVHRVGALAAELAGTLRVWEATVDRTLLLRALRLARLARRFDLTPFESAFTPRAGITHTVDVRRYTGCKRAALAAHATQTTGGDQTRTLTALLSLPPPLFRLVMGTEWYIERKRLRAR